MTKELRRALCDLIRHYARLRKAHFYLLGLSYGSSLKSRLSRF
jgi:hypothetical protein